MHSFILFFIIIILKNNMQKMTIINDGKLKIIRNQNKKEGIKYFQTRNTVILRMPSH